MKFSSVPAYTIQGKPSQDALNTINNSPGPCAYNLNSDLTSKPSYTFSQSIRPNLFKPVLSPGPGDYLISSPQATLTKRKKPSISPPLKEKTRQVLPGPGFYNPKQQFSTLQFTMGNKIPESAPEKDHIGPGSYFPVKPTLQLSRSTVFSKGFRFKDQKNLSPGPGSYNTLPTKVVTTKFAQASRDIKNSDTSPGPGHYETSALNSVGKTIAGRNFTNKKLENSPGPGAYEVLKSSKDFSPVYSMGRAEKLKTEKSDSGPGYLNLGSTFKLPGKTFPKAGRKELTNTNQVPGPGTFNIPSTIGEGPKISMIERRGKYQISEVPGPGFYSSPVHENLISSTFSKQARWKQQVKDTPGPGQYDLPKQKIPGFTFKKDINEREDSDEEPGPGHYIIPSSIPDIPKYYQVKANPTELNHY